MSAAVFPVPDPRRGSHISVGRKGRKLMMADVKEVTRDPVSFEAEQTRV